MNKLSFPKGIGQEVGMNAFPIGKSKVSLSLPTGIKDKWIWSNDKQGYLFVAELNGVKYEGVATAGIFANSPVVNEDGTIDGTFTCNRSKRHTEFIKG